MTDIYNKDRMKCRTQLQIDNTLFEMGKQLEGVVNEITVKNQKMFNTVVNLNASNWEDRIYTATIDGITPTSTIWVSSEPTNATEYSSAGVEAIVQGDGYLSFRCRTTPVNNLYVIVVWTEI